MVYICYVSTLELLVILSLIISNLLEKCILLILYTKDKKEKMNNRMIAGAAVALLVVLIGVYWMMSGPAADTGFVEVNGNGNGLLAVDENGNGLVAVNGGVVVVPGVLSDVKPDHQWKKILENTNWASGSDHSLNKRGISLNQCMNLTLDNNRPGFVYHAGNKNCLLKNSFGQGSKRPNSPGWVAYVR